MGITQNEDCPNALKICTKDELLFLKINNVGMDPIESKGTCLGEGVSSFNDAPTKWIYFAIEKSGILTFVIQPLNLGDDIDFAFFELPDGIRNCATRKVLRCNATAPPCSVNTGLNLTSIDTTEDFNCNPGEDGFCKFVELIQGQSYALMISCFSQSGSGVKISFDGLVEFEDSGCAVSVNDPINKVIEFYPNPAKDRIYSSVDLSLFDELYIYNNNGKLINNYKLTNNKSIDISNLDCGIYVIRLRHNDGSFLATRIVINRD